MPWRSRRTKALHAFVEAYAGLIKLWARCRRAAVRKPRFTPALWRRGRVDAEIERMQPPANSKPSTHRIAITASGASAHGEKILRYADWIERYKVDLIREIAANLR